MFHRLTATVVLAACATTYALAAERATFILTSGERKSGPVVFHGDAHENLINGYLNIGVDGGKDLTFPLDQVAVIDFVGGTPPASELSKLPAGAGHMLVLRDGNTQSGRFVNMIGGDTLIWQNGAGERQQYGIRDVSRVYLNPQSARTAFNYTAPVAVAPAAPSAPTVESGAMRVEATQNWTDTGISVRKGDRVAFRATGQIRLGQGTGQTATPDGNADARQGSDRSNSRRSDRADDTRQGNRRGNAGQGGNPVPTMAVGGLVGQVGNADPFPIGSNTEPIIMPADGRLMLGVNERDLSDNSGFFSVNVTRVR